MAVAVASSVCSAIIPATATTAPASNASPSANPILTPTRRLSNHAICAVSRTPDVPEVVSPQADMPVNDGAVLISVVVPVYNEEQFIRPCLDAVFGQDEPVHEVIVVDNGSGDGTLRVLDNYADR